MPGGVIDDLSRCRRPIFRVQFHHGCMDQTVQTVPKSVETGDI